MKVTVEILKEGAAAIYGSEVIYSVVKLSMRRDFEVAQISLSSSASLRSSSINKESDPDDAAQQNKLTGIKGT